jgi:DNA polymerase-3 subunit gamma/tau
MIFVTAQFAPTTAKRKVYIIDEVHMLSKSAFNALLKTLEEPPENTYFILATTEAHKILDTIISRCQRFDFHRIGTEHVVEVLKKVGKKEGVKTDEEALEIIAHNAKGSLRDALSIFEQITYKNAVTMDGVKQSLGMASSNVVKQFIDAVRGKRVTEALTFVSDLLAEGIDLGQFTNEVLLFLRVEMLEAVGQDNKEDVRNLIDLIEIFFEANYGLRDTVISQLPLEMAIVRACREVTFPSSSTTEETVETQDLASSEAPVSPETPETPETPKTQSKDPEKKTIESLINSIEKASIRTILKNAEMTQDKKAVNIRVGSDFAKSKLEIAENSQALSEGVKNLFGDDIKIKITVEEKKSLDEGDVNAIFG